MSRVANVFDVVFRRVLRSIKELGESVGIKQQVKPYRTFPPEVLLEIFQYLQPSEFLPAHEDLYVLIDVDPVRQVLPRHLYNACFVCRAWYPPATALLYTRVFLPSARRLRLFHLTLQHRPDLIPFVRQLSIRDNDQADTAHFKIVKSRRLKHAAKMKANVFAVITACTNLSSLSLYLSYKPGENSIATIFQQSDPFPSLIHLRNLNLVGGCRYTIPVVFPGIKRLLLHRTKLDVPSFDPNHLRRLESVIMLRVHPSERDSPVIECIERLPLLRSLELIETAFRPSTTRSPPLHNLEKLTMISQPTSPWVGIPSRSGELETFRRWIDNGAIPNVKEITIGVFDGRDALAPWFIFPSNLVSLTIVVQIYYFGGRLIESASSAAQESIMECLEQNKSRLKSGRFKRLELLVTVAFGETRTGDTLPSSKIREFCRDYGVSFKLSHIDSASSWAEKRIMQSKPRLQELLH
ncbi:unnamed protein product [Somion occarium]|uniref:F-box domain-containing protein n=1 Tax=Somion occarium TaxID=3059160 RepID=A0ABP1ED42_9APHY